MPKLKIARLKLRYTTRAILRYKIKINCLMVGCENGRQNSIIIWFSLPFFPLFLNFLRYTKNGAKM
jgi:hypothetical protein